MSTEGNEVEGNGDDIPFGDDGPQGEASQLVKHAQRELTLAGLFEEDSDYGGMIGKCVMDLIETFAGNGHSGGSAYMTLAAFDEVAHYRVLTPITSDPEHWMKVSENVWQSTRQPSVFSNDGGQTWSDIEDIEFATPTLRQRIIAALEEAAAREVPPGAEPREGDESSWGRYADTVIAAFDGPHVLLLQERTWSLEHPLRCRESLGDCEVRARLEVLSDALVERFGGLGRYEVTLESLS